MHTMNIMMVCQLFRQNENFCYSIDSTILTVSDPPSVDQILVTCPFVDVLRVSLTAKYLMSHDCHVMSGLVVELSVPLEFF